jgi:hypothetical protein
VEEEERERERKKEKKEKGPCMAAHRTKRTGPAQAMPAEGVAIFDGQVY